MAESCFRCGQGCRPGDPLVLVCGNRDCGRLAHAPCVNWFCGEGCRVIHVGAETALAEQTMQRAADPDGGEAGAAASGAAADTSGTAGHEDAVLRLAEEESAHARNMQALRGHVNDHDAAGRRRNGAVEQGNAEGERIRAELDTARGAQSAEREARTAAAARVARAAAAKAAAAQQLLRCMQVDRALLQFFAGRAPINLPAGDRAPFGHGVHLRTGPMDAMTMHRGARYENLISAIEMELFSSGVELSDWCLLAYEPEGTTATAVLFNPVRVEINTAAPDYLQKTKATEMNARLLQLADFATQATPPLAALGHPLVAVHAHSVPSLRPRPWRRWRARPSSSSTRPSRACASASATLRGLARACS